MTDGQTPNPASAAQLYEFWNNSVGECLSKGIAWPETATTMLMIAALNLAQSIGHRPAARMLMDAAQYLTKQAEMADQEQERARSFSKH